ncbi:MAG: FecR domain-containing protein [Bacteroidetes bacterium]|nr:FecR domain-containing protein [Bacteroidota bacterium]
METNNNSLINEIIEQVKNDGNPINSNDIAIYKKILDQSQNWIIPEGRVEEESWISIQSRLEDDTKVVPIFPWLKWAASIAAIILIAISLILIVPDKENYLADGITEITLPDGSIVTLNTGSSLSFSNNIFGKRSIEFEGEGFFEVIPGKEFTVETSKGLVTVLGTSFNVSSFDNDFIVKCYTGKVKVNNLDKEAILTPGFELKTLNGESSGIQAFDTSQGEKWVSGLFSYNNEPLSNVFAEIQRQFGVEIIIGTDNIDRSFSGLFSNEDKIDEVLKTVCAAMGLSFELTEAEKYVISE